MSASAFTLKFVPEIVVVGLEQAVAVVDADAEALATDVGEQVQIVVAVVAVIAAAGNSADVPADGTPARACPGRPRRSAAQVGDGDIVQRAVLRRGELLVDQLGRGILAVAVGAAEDAVAQMIEMDIEAQSDVGGDRLVPVIRRLLEADQRGRAIGRIQKARIRIEDDVQRVRRRGRGESDGTDSQ